MTKKVLDEMRDLVRQIDKHNNKYYLQDDPEISDEEYDMLMRRLRELESKYPDLVMRNSPTVKVGGGVAKGFEEVKHITPMYSLGNQFNNEEFEKWFTGICNELGEKDPIIVSELKYDGLSLSIVYEDGHLVRAVTRGDGVVGEDVTENVLVIEGIPKVLHDPKLQGVVEIRGEIYMTYAAFMELNEASETLGLKKLSNVRNAAAGSLRQHNPELVRQRKLSFTAYGGGIGFSEEDGFISHSEILDLLAKNGIPIAAKYEILRSAKECIEYYKVVMGFRGDLPYAIDGVVYKLDMLDQREHLGFTSREPRWATAFKFPALVVKTVFKDASFQIGRTGVVTPVANLEPVSIEGVVVENATLHNFGEIERLGIYKGATVSVRRAGDVVPQIVGVDDPLDNPPVGQRLDIPTRCPSCNSPLETRGAYLYCTGKYYCEEKVIAQIIHYASRRAMNIEGLGDVVAANMVRTLGVRNPVDIYNLTVDDLLKLPDFAERSANNLYTAIQKTLRPLSNLIFALGIDDVGEYTGNVLAKTFRSMEALSKAPAKVIEMIPGIGQSTARSIRSWFENPSNESVANKLVTLAQEQPYWLPMNDRQQLVSEPMFLNVVMGKDCSTLLKLFPSIDSIMEAPIDTMLELKPTKRTLELFHNIRSAKTEIDQLSTFLQEIGIHWTLEKLRDKHLPLIDQSIVVTGEIEGYTRDDIKEILEDLGASVKGSVSSKTDGLIKGDGGGGKYEKAKSLDIPILDGSMFKSFLDWLKTRPEGDIGSYLAQL